MGGSQQLSTLIPGRSEVQGHGGYLPPAVPANIREGTGPSHPYRRTHIPALPAHPSGTPASSSMCMCSAQGCLLARRSPECRAGAATSVGESGERRGEEEGAGTGGGH